MRRRSLSDFDTQDVAMDTFEVNSIAESSNAKEIQCAALDASEERVTFAESHKADSARPDTAFQDLNASEDRGQDLEHELIA
jgi:hypothetical protein